METRKIFEEKKHRLPAEYYRGETSVAFTLCLRERREAFIRTEIVAIFKGYLHDSIKNSECIVPAYCFMPDHQHIVVTGINAQADTWKTVVRYKQKTGYWMSKNMPQAEWQKDFYDHVIRKKEDVARQVKYVLDNPVRKGLVTSWRDYPFQGSLGCDLEAVLSGLY